jgi:hypothetical protein
MKRAVATLIVTVIALLVPATAAHAEPDPPRPADVQLFWPICVTLVGTTICFPG